MASPNQQSVDLPILTFGGMVTQYDPQTLPPGASPFNQDVAFSGVNAGGGAIVGGWGSRPALGAGFYATPFAGNPSVNYIKTFQDSIGNYHELCIDSLGVFRDESPAPTVPGVPSVVGQVLAASFLQSDALFNREFIAIGDGIFGIDIPRQYDGTYFDRVSQVGPGAPPTVEDGTTGNVDAGLHQIAVAFITREYYITKPSPWVNYTAPGSKNIALTNIPIGPPNIIGRIILATGVITPPATTGDFYYFDGAVPTPTAGTFPSMVIMDNVTTSYTIDFISAVLENTPVATNLFNLLELGECSQMTSYSDRTFWCGERYKLPNFINTTFDGGFSATGVLTQVSRTSNVFGSLPLFGSSGNWTGGGTVILPKNSAGDYSDYLTIVSFGFTIPSGATIVGIVDSIQVQSNSSGAEQVSDFLVQPVKNGAVTGASLNNGNLWPTVAAAQVYGGPSNLWGNTQLPADINNAASGVAVACVSAGNAGIPAGQVISVTRTVYYLAPVGGAIPLGWTEGAFFAGGNSALASGLPAYWGDAYAIIGDGVTLNRGLIVQGAYQDSLGVPILQPNVSYRVRARVAQNGILTSGALYINLQSTIGGFVTQGLILLPSQLTSTYQEFQAFLTDVPLTTVPSDITLQVYAGATPNNGGAFVIDCIEIYPITQPFNRTLIRASYAEDPESFDALTGLLSINAGDGETARLTFNILDDKLYIVKDRSMYVTQDDGQNEPSSWTINTVSGTVGTPSSRGVGVGESWAVIAHHDGAYIFWGSEPVKISQEIQPTWDRINWQYGYCIYVLVDTKNKRIHIGVPLDANTAVSCEFVCDYSQLANSEGSTSAQDIASHPQAYYSVYQPTKLTAPGKSRKWTIWNISTNCAALTVRSDNSYHLLRGNGLANGKIYDQQPTNTNDDGVPVNYMYQTSYMPQTEDEQVLQLGAHRKLFKYLTGYVYGAGNLNFYVYGAQDQRGLQLSPLTLKNPAQWDYEKNVNWVGERFSLMWVTDEGLSSWATMTKACPTLQRELFTPVRGNQ